MSNMMYGSLNDLVDGKFLVLRKMDNHPEAGTMVHIMDVAQNQNGSYNMYYRVTETGQDGVNTFINLKEFYNWARPDSFIARNYEFLTLPEIQRYIRAKKRNVFNFCLPLMCIMLALVWALMFILLDTPLSIVLGAVISIVGCAVIFMYYRNQKKRLVRKMYKDLLQKRYGLVIE